LAFSVSLFCPAGSLHGRELEEIKNITPYYYASRRLKLVSIQKAPGGNNRTNNKLVSKGLLRMSGGIPLCEKILIVEGVEGFHHLKRFLVD